MVTKNKKNPEEPQKGFGIVHQYIKDLSFENLLTANDMLNIKLQPNGEISLSVSASPIQDNAHEVIIKVKVEAKDIEHDKNVYITEIEYAAIIQVEGYDATETNGILMVEAPRLMFPYVRSNIADITREGGFSPLVMAPIDFLGLFLENTNQEASE